MSAETPSPLPPQQKRLVRDSFEVVQDYASSLTKLFYGRLLRSGR